MNLERIEVIGIGEPILLLHGMGGPKPLNSIQVELSKSYKTIKPIMPGFLEEDGIIEYSDDYYVEYIEKVREKLGVSQWVVLGYSMGGRSALDYAISYPDRISKLIIVDSVGIDYMMPILKFSWGKNIMKKCLYHALKYPLVQETLGKAEFKNPLSEEYKLGKQWVYDMMKIPSVRRNFVEILTSIGTPINKLSSKLNVFRKDTLILWAEDDTTALLKTGYILKNMIKDSKMITLPKYKHMAPIENPDFYVQNIIGFLDNSL